MKIEAFIDNQFAQPQEEWRAMTLVADFQTGEKSISVEQIVLAGENAKIANQWRADGLAQTRPGILEGIPFRLKIDGTEVFNGCFDTSTATWECDEVSGGTIARKGFDFLTKRGESFRFPYLRSIGTITPDMYVPKNYVVGQYPKVIEILFAAFTIYSLTLEIIKTVKEVINVISATFGGQLGIFEAIAQGVALIAYLVGLVAAISEFIKQLIELIFPFVYYHYAMRVKQQLELGCQHLQLGFSSTILDEFPNLCIEPAKNVEGVKFGLQSDDRGEYDGTLSELLRLMADMFTAEIQVIDGVVYFEQWPFYQSLSTYTLPPVRIRSDETNADEIQSNYLFSWSRDAADLWSYEVVDGVRVQVTREPIIVEDQANVLLDGLDEKRMPLVLPNVVKQETELDKIMRKVWNTLNNVVSTIKGVINTIGKAFGGGGKTSEVPRIPNFGSIGADRQDTHFTSLPRIFIAGEEGQIDLSSNDILAATQLYQDWNSINSPVTSKALNLGNQWVRYSQVEIEMCAEDFFKLCDNHYTTYLGQPARVLKIDWSPFEYTAKVDFEVNQKYTHNLKETIKANGQL